MMELKSDLEKKKILLVDDEPNIVMVVEARLKANNYEVITAANGEEALTKAREEKPDLIILDLMLPKIDGYQVCRLLKFDKNYSNIPIILLTAKGQREDREWGEKAGADAYITKPFEAAVLLGKIKELVTP